MAGYKRIKQKPLTPEEIDQKILDVDEEMEAVLEWKKEEENKLKKNKFKNHQAKSACKRALKKANRRVNSVKGMQDYWKNRKNGMSHFHASIELNEYWASLKEKAPKKEKKPKVKIEIPDILKKHGITKI